MAPQIVIAEPMWEEASYPTLDQDSGAIRARVPYRVNSSELEEVYSAAGLPQMGQSFGGAFANLVVVGLSIRWLLAGDIDADDYGYSVVEVSYSTISGQPEILVAKQNEAFTSVVQGTGSVQIRADILGQALYEPISVEAPTDELIVNAYRANFDPATHWNSIRRKVNANPVTLPPIFKTSGPAWIAAPGTLLARNAEVSDAQEDLILVRYHFGLAPSWTSPQRRTDPDTQQPTGPQTDFQVYDSIAFDTTLLWGF